MHNVIVQINQFIQLLNEP